MPQLLPFFIVLFAGVFFSEIFRKWNVPWVVTLILGGVIIGPFGLDIFASNTTLDFLADIGLVFLMFMAGLETRLSGFRGLKKEITTISLLNGGIPFLVGVGIGTLFGLPFISSLLLGTIFISSSVAVIIPSLQSNHLSETRVGKAIISATVIEDIVSLIALSLILQTIAPITKLPLPLFYILLFITLLVLRWFITKLRNFSHLIFIGHQDIFQQELRSIFAILIGTVLAFEFLGLHPIIAGFFAGLVLSDLIKSQRLIEKLHAISYGIFIPIFFIVVGTKTDLSVFNTTNGSLTLILAVVGGALIAKYISGALAGRLSNFSKNESRLIGAASLPQLSTTLAVAFSGLELGLFSNAFLTAIIVLSISTTLVAPLLIHFFAQRI
jgi:Kef-type K+ transport system membrane component KefB